VLSLASTSPFPTSAQTGPSGATGVDASRALLRESNDWFGTGAGTAVRAAPQPAVAYGSPSRVPVPVPMPVPLAHEYAGPLEDVGAASWQAELSRRDPANASDEQHRLDLAGPPAPDVRTGRRYLLTQARITGLV
jgi:hypothetical protein